MAIVPHLVEKNNDVGDRVIDGIVAVIIAIDDSVETDDAAVRQAAVDKINSDLSGPDSTKLPDGYFDSNRVISTTFDADDDIFMVTGASIRKYENIA